MIKFQALLFDVDDTLYDRKQAFIDWANHYVTSKLDIHSDIVIDTMLNKVSHLDGAVYGSKKELIEEFMAIYPPPAGSDYDPKKAYEEFFATTKLDSAAVELLGHLDQINFPYGIVTNGDARQVEKVEKLGLTERIKCLFVSDTFGGRKPDAPIFIAASNCIGYAPSEVLYVGDNPSIDIAGAHNAGMQTAWLPNGQPWPTDRSLPLPDVTLNTLLDILPLLPTSVNYFS